MAAADFYELVQKFYVGFYGRPADSDGLEFWAEKADSEGWTSVRDAFANSDEAQDFVFTNPETEEPYNNEELVNNIYQNVFGRDAEDEGLDYYVGKLEDGEMTLDSIVNNVIVGAQNEDATVLDNKVEVAQYFTDNLGDAKYDEDQISLARSVIEGELTDVDEAKTKADDAINEMTYDGNVVELTTADDVVGPDVEDEDFQTTADDDLIEGTASSLSSERTLNAEDQIDGGDGDDTLGVTMKGNFGGFSGDGEMKNVETVDLTNDSSIARTFDATGAEGVEKYVLNAENAALNLSNLEGADAEVVVNNQESGKMSIGYDSDAELEEAAQAVNLNNVGTVEDEEEEVDEEDVELTIDDVPEVNLTVNGDNVVDLSNLDAEDLTVAGEGTLKVTDVGEDLETFDASEASGDVEVDVTGADEIGSVITGAGDDEITGDTDTLKKNAEIDGGAGTNQLNLSGQGTVQFNMANVQTAALGDLGNDGLTFSAKETSGLEEIVATDELGDHDAVFSSMGGSDITVTLQDGSEGSVRSDHSGSTTANVAASEDADKDNEEESSSNLDFSDSSAVNLKVDEHMDYTGDVTAGSADSVEATIDGTMDNTITASDATSGVFNAADKVTVGLDAGSMTDLNVVAEDDFTLDTDTDLSSLESLVVETEGFFDAKDADMESMATAELSGTGQVELGTLGAEDQDYSLTVTATGLENDDGTTALTIDEMLVDDGQSITLNVGDVLGDVTLNDGATVKDGSGSITVNADGTGGNLELDDLTAKEVTVEAGDALGTLEASITGDTIDVEGAGLDTNTLFATVNEDGTATMSGGIDEDSLAVYNNDGASSSLTGDIGDDDFIFGREGYDEFETDTMVDTITDFESGDQIFTGDSDGGTVSDVTDMEAGTQAFYADGSTADGTFADDDELIYLDDESIATFYKVDNDGSTGNVDGTGAGDVTGIEDYEPDSLEDALTVLDDNLAEDSVALFDYDGSTYMFIGDATAGNMFDTGEEDGEDQVIELQGVSDAEDAADALDPS